MVMSYLGVKPGNEMKQCSQCPGPREVRWRWKSTLFPMPIQYEWCQCDGNGMCRWSLEDSPLGPRKSLRCTCDKDCVKNMTEQQMRQQQQMFRSAWTAKAVIVAWVLSQCVQRRRCIHYCIAPGTIMNSVISAATMAWLLRFPLHGASPPKIKNDQKH